MSLLVCCRSSRPPKPSLASLSLHNDRELAFAVSYFVCACVWPGTHRCPVAVTYIVEAGIQHPTGSNPLPLPHPPPFSHRFAVALLGVEEGRGNRGALWVRGRGKRTKEHEEKQKSEKKIQTDTIRADRTSKTDTPLLIHTCESHTVIRR